MGEEEEEEEEEEVEVLSTGSEIERSESGDEKERLVAKELGILRTLIFGESGSPLSPSKWEAEKKLRVVFEHMARSLERYGYEKAEVLYIG